MSNIAFIHDCLLDGENQMCERLDQFQGLRYGINSTNAVKRLKQIVTVCEDIKELAEELQEKAKESIAELEVSE